MQINSLPDTNGSRCILTYDEQNRWLRATWRGFVDSDEAWRGANNYLNKLPLFQCAGLLNDNHMLEGPWFDSLEWIKRVWLPFAHRLGLRYVAHVVQNDTGTDILTRAHLQPVISGVELQIFDHLHEAEAWLRACLSGPAVQPAGNLASASQPARRLGASQ